MSPTYYIKQKGRDLVAPGMILSFFCSGNLLLHDSTNFGLKERERERERERPSQLRSFAATAPLFSDRTQSERGTVKRAAEIVTSVRVHSTIGRITYEPLS